LVAAAATGGAVEVVGAIADHLKPVIAKMTEMGVMLEERDNSIFVKSSFPLKSVDLKTLPYPGFPTDMQAQMMALLMLAKGTSVVTETVFENRFMHVEEFKRMNGRIRIDGRTAIVDGQCQLQGARVTATDLRAAAALIIAGLVASGETEVLGLNHLDRGYVDLVGKLRSLGADVERVYAHDELSEKVLS
jgi:UDP-N-acetylglucosamine 1-carboxyvinyltransferase